MVDPLKKMVCVMSIYFETGRELKIGKESNDIADLAKVLPESYQKSNGFSVNTEDVDVMLLQTTEEHLLIKTRCVVFNL